MFSESLRSWIHPVLGIRNVDGVFDATIDIKNWL